MLKVIDQDITAVANGIICHQVNCKGVMGAGLAKQIRSNFPMAYSEYMRAYREGRLKLGNVVFVLVNTSPMLIVAHLCGQDRYGRDRMYTDYAALKQCLTIVYQTVQPQRSLYGTDIPIYVPYNMGCALAGGDWSIVSNLIEVAIPDAIVARYG